MAHNRRHVITDVDLLVTQLDNANLEVRKVIIIDGESTYYRYVITPGEDVSQEDERVKALALQVHTPAIIDAWRVDERKQQ